MRSFTPWSAAPWPDGWLAVLARANPHTVGAAVVHVGVALLALGVARWTLPPRAQAWRRVAAGLLLLAVVQLLSLDLLFVELARALAQAGGWYQGRRTLQVLVLLGLLLAGLALGGRDAVPAPPPQAAPGLFTDLRPSPPQGDAWLRLGMGLVLCVTVLRFVSLHATDQWLGWRVEGVSLGRWAEGLGLLVVGLRAGWLLRTEASGVGV